MSIRIALHHKTVYRYDRPVALTPHEVRLRPAPHTRTPVHSYALKVTPADHFIHWQQDPFGNHVARLTFRKPARELAVEVDLVADMVTVNPFDFFVEDYAEHWPFEYGAQLKRDLAPYLEPAEAGPRLRALAAAVPRAKRRSVDLLMDLNRQLSEAIQYVIRMEPGVQGCEETLALGKGSCRDSGWLLAQQLRHLGLATRFVSGYLVQLAPDIKSLDGPSGPEQDFTDLHAWCEVYLPGAGWIGLDPTSGLAAGEGHIPLACTPEPTSAAPITGGYLGEECHVDFRFENKVARYHEDPRVTKPYDEAQWVAIMGLGEAVDCRLQDEDVRLMMGGEPTFVSIDDMDGDEWTTAALGAHKRERAEVLLRRLWRRWAGGGVLHHGQGKWYPGEPLPRWALSCLWRADGEPVWRQPELLADPTGAGTADTALGTRFAAALADKLGLPEAHVVPGYEDGWYYLWKEGNLPENVDVLDSRLADPLERARLRRIFEQGLDRVVGHALPLSWDPVAEHWISSAWRFRRGHLFLLPGDSPMGLRLPLDALLWEPEEARHVPQPRDPFAPDDALPYGEVWARYARRAGPAPEPFGMHGQGLADGPRGAGDTFVRTALCIEPRNGVLHLFLPPLTHLGHWLALVQAIEQTAAELDEPIVLEGYEAPHDDRLRRFSITPDPGVIEVNVAPEASWPALVRLTEVLYEEARLARLGTEKFMLDGRHVGTGGGNHVTLGGPSAADSPLLRRPHLLGSLVRYWQNHPGLSYLFSGLFVGPTSQAPRVDEARDDALYELDIALQQLPDGDTPLPWLIDRVLRNQLVDLTGNTHRAEFCIDKLYSPDSPAGRRGLVELRAFEMPPHARMSLVQQLLVRALVACFWSQPYDQRPVRWGTELHDRFMLPHFVRRDLDGVVEDLRRWGLPFDGAWLEPFHEFRFPRYGTVNIDDVEIELRFAIEPWHVLGEEVVAQGTARFVDASLERLQVKASGLIDGRHLIACNGRRLPLRNTGRRGEYVAGVRFKAWQPPSGLHPTIAPQTPLVLDLIDTWSGRSLGGCTYHVEHPGGRNPETFPVNANEAESRRLARFWTIGHTPGEVRIPPEEPGDEQPYTLDLRRRVAQ